MLLLLKNRGVDYAAVPGLCSKHMPVLGFGERERESEREKREREEGEEKEKEEESYLSLGVLHPFIPDCLGDLLAPPRFIPTLRCIVCLLSHNDIVNGNNTSAYREVSAATMDEWWCNGKANLFRCHLEVFGGSLLLGRVCR